MDEEAMWRVVEADPLWQIASTNHHDPMSTKTVRMKLRDGSELVGVPRTSSQSRHAGRPTLRVQVAGAYQLVPFEEVVDHEVIER